MRAWTELESLAKTGLFGKSPGEVAEQLVRERLRELLLEGWPSVKRGRNVRK